MECVQFGMTEKLQKGEFMSLGVVSQGSFYRDHSYQSNSSKALAGDFYSSISAAAEAVTNNDQQFFQEHMEEIMEKIKKGDTEESFQIGGNSFTLKEWERFLEKFDSAEDDVKKQLKELIEERIKAQKKADALSKERQSSEEI